MNWLNVKQPAPKYDKENSVQQSDENKIIELEEFDRPKCDNENSIKQSGGNEIIEPEQNVEIEMSPRAKQNVEFNESPTRQYKKRLILRIYLR